MKTSDHRKHIPIGVKLHACLLLLGFTEEEIVSGIHFDHTPPLALRFVDPETGELVPAANDPRHIQPLRKVDHARKTNGGPATSAGGDIHAIAKAKRLNSGHEAFRARMLAPDKRRDEVLPSRWPKRSFQNKKSRTK